MALDLVCKNRGSRSRRKSLRKKVRHRSIVEIMRLARSAALVISCLTYDGLNSPANAQSSGVAAFALTSISADARGNVYVADSVTHQILKIAASTHASTVLAGSGAVGFGGDGGPAIHARLSASISSMAVDAAGNVYFLQEPTNPPDPNVSILITLTRSGCANLGCIRKISVATGIISTVLVAPPLSMGAMMTAVSIPVGGMPDVAAAAKRLSSYFVIGGFTVGDGGDLYVVDKEFNRILRVANGSTKAVPVAGTVATNQPFKNGEMIVTAGKGDGERATMVPLGTLDAPIVDHEGSLYFSESGKDGTISTSFLRKVDASSGVISTVKKQPVAVTAPQSCSQDSQPFTPSFLAVDAHDAIYYAEPNMPPALISQPTLQVLMRTPTDCGDSTIIGASFDASGNLYTATSNGVVREIHSGSGKQEIITIQQ